jgi:hypothetical protein
MITTSSRKLEEREMDRVLTINENLSLADEDLNAVKKAIKIGFYKSFYKKGIITNLQLEKLMQMQNEK